MMSNMLKTVAVSSMTPSCTNIRPLCGAESLIPAAIPIPVCLPNRYRLSHAGMHSALRCRSHALLSQPQQETAENRHFSLNASSPLSFYNNHKGVCMARYDHDAK